MLRHDVIFCLFLISNFQKQIEWLFMRMQSLEFQNNIQPSELKDITNILRENDEIVRPTQKHKSDSIQGTDYIANDCIIAGSLEAAYSLNWGARQIWGKGGGETLALL